MENLLAAWKEFLRGKRNRHDVQNFQYRLLDNMQLLHEELRNFSYTHSGYEAFKINDPKPRDIHKAKVKDRLLHHAIYRKFYPFFDKTFIADSFSCRLNKGTHKAMNRFRDFTLKTSKNNTKTCWVLKCDIRKFFASIDHEILKNILAQYIPDKNVLWLLGEVIESFNTNGKNGVGLPLGNLTSQLFVNIYMNEFDQFVKHKLKVKHYVRYADDFVLLSDNRDWLEKQIPIISAFLKNKLKLELHPDKVFIKTIAAGVDFLGCVSFPKYRVLRTKTKRRIIKKIGRNFQDMRKGVVSKEYFDASLQSYFGVLKHCKGWKIKEGILKQIK